MFFSSFFVVVVAWTRLRVRSSRKRFLLLLLASFLVLLRRIAGSMAAGGDATHRKSPMGKYCRPIKNARAHGFKCRPLHFISDGYRAPPATSTKGCRSTNHGRFKWNVTFDGRERFVRHKRAGICRAPRRRPSGEMCLSSLPDRKSAARID